MTLKQLFKLFIKFDMSDCTGAIFTYLHGASLTLDLFLVRKLENFLENLSVESIYGAGLNISKSWFGDMTKIIAVDQ